MTPFRGPGGVRAGWRLLAFLLVVNVPLTGAQWLVIHFLKIEHADLRPAPLILAEAIALVFALVATMAMARRERRSLGDHGLPLRDASGLSPNTGNEGLPLPGHLLDGRFHGSQLLTGGGMGAEASLWMFPMLALLYWLFQRRHPAAR